MGELFRSYWLPVMPSADLEEGPTPRRVELLGERLVICRPAGGPVSLIEEFCAHWGASLFYGSCDGEGIRCPFHGWKYDASGQCVDMPNEPVSSLTLNMLVATGGPIGAARPRGGEAASGLLASAQRDGVAVAVIRPLAGGALTRGSGGARRRRSAPAGRDGSVAGPGSLRACHRPRGGAGGRVANRRDDHRGGRLPFRSRVRWGDHGAGRLLLRGAPARGAAGGGHGPARSAEDRRNFQAAKGVHMATFPGTYEPVLSVANDYGRDPSLQRMGSVTGILGIGTQDTAVQVSMGPIVDRTREHLATADIGIVTARRRLLATARALTDGQVDRADLPGRDPSTQLVRSASAIVEDGESWKEHTSEERRVVRVT